MEKEAQASEIHVSFGIFMVVSPDVHCRVNRLGLKEITHNSYEYKEPYLVFPWPVQMILWALIVSSIQTSEG